MFFTVCLRQKPQAINTNQPDTTPIQQLLNTTELMELALSYLPVKDLLLAQRTCVHLRQIIEHSSLLQKALFYRKSKSENGEGWVLTSEDQLLSGEKATKYLENVATTTPDPKPIVIVPVVFNPLVLSRYCDAKPSSIDNLLSLSLRPHMAADDCFELYSQKASEEDSCYNMFLTMPPGKVVDIMIVGKRRDKKYGWTLIARGRVKNPDGVTLGDVMQKDIKDGWSGRVLFPHNLVVSGEVKKWVEEQ